MSLELQDLIRLSGEHRDFEKKYLVVAHSIPQEVKNKTFDLGSPISYIFVISTHDDPDDAMKNMIEYINRFPYLSFEIVRTTTLHGLGGKKKEFNLNSEVWKSATPDAIKDIMSKKEKEEKIKLEVQREREKQDDETSIDFFRFQFFNICQNREAIESKRKDLLELENVTLERINKCLKFIFENPKACIELKELYRERLDARGESRLADYLISKLNDVDETGIPKVLSPKI